MNQETFPLTALQQGMLLHSLSAPQAGVYVQQLVCDLEEPLDTLAFGRAWAHLVERHDALRVSFGWDAQGSPRQRFHEQVDIPWDERDWRGRSLAEQQELLEAFLDADLRRGIDLTAPPLFRLAMFHLDQAHFQLVWTYHHALLDGRSRLILQDELFEIYEAMRDGRPLALAPAPSFRPFVEWLQTRDTSSTAPFWRGVFAGKDPPAHLSSGGRGPGESRGAVFKQSVRLSHTVSERLRSIATAHGLTLNTLLHGAWAILLSRYTEQRAVAFGAIRAGRHAGPPGASRAVGLFINTLPVPVDVDPDARLLPWLAELRDVWVAMRPHEHTSLVDIRQWIGAPGTELFDSLVVFENYEANARLRKRGDQWQHRTFRLRGKTNYPLVVNGFNGAQMLLEIDYDVERFVDDAIRRMLGHLEHILTGFTGEPEQTLAQIPLLTDWERHQLLVEWNDTTVEYPRDRCIHELFESQVERSPDSVAVVWDDQQLTYGNLNERANQLAHHLRSLGVAPESLVGLCMERSPALVIGVLAILKTGAAYVPLDPGYPPQWMALILEDAGVTHLVTQTPLLGRLPATSARFVCVDRDAALVQSAARSNPRVNVDPDSLAYVMFTSGSTGQPKGVAVRHTSIARLVFGNDYATFGPDRVFLQLTAASFDVSTFEIWGALLHGARLVVAPAGPPDFRLLEGLLARHAVTTLWLTASLFNQIIDDYPQALTGVGELLLGGEALSVRHVRRAQQVLGARVQLINGYGPTEATTFATCYRIPPDLPPGLESIPIGRPIANTQVYVLDHRRQPVPIGVAGELYIGGAGVARDYLHRPALTAERFVPDPFSGQPGARLYRTGDHCRWRADGELEFLGRLDSQVKLRGFRIELGEIEAALSEHPDIARSVVALREDAPGGQRLVAYCVPTPDANLDLARLTRHLRSRLPDYMVPAALVVLDTLPLTPSGKVDRRALPTPGASPRRERVTGHAGPRTLIEQQLVFLWCEVLAIEDIDIHDNFFALGGHSLLAARVTARIVAALQVELPLRTLFDAPTVAELSAEIDAVRRGGRSPHDAPLKRSDRQANEGMALSFAQQRLWLLEQVEGELTVYNMPYGWRLRGPLDAEALRRALEAVVRRHEPLRTTFTLIAGEPAQVVRDVERFELPLEDLSGLGTDQQVEQLARRNLEEAGRPFDLTADPMLRGSLVRLGEHEHVLLLTMHHIASDAWSLSVLWRELSLLYGAFRLGAMRELPDLPVRYADFAAWQRNELAGSRRGRMVQDRRGQLQGAAPLELPTDRQRPAVPTYRGARREFEIDENLVGQLKALSQREGVTLQMTLLAAFQTLLTRYTGQQDIAVGTPTAGRHHEAVEGLVGCFVNILVLRTDVSGDPTFRELLRRVRAVSLDAYDHQDLPFERLVEELQPQRNASRSPLVQVLFQLLIFSDTDLALPDLQVSRLPSRHQRVRFDVEMHLWQQTRNIRGVLVYSVDLFDSQTIDRMVDHFMTLLAGIVAELNRRLSELPMLTDAERHQLLVAWNDTTSEYPRDRCVHQLFEAQVDRNPHAIALVSGEHQWTYGEVNREANRLANHLIGRGLGPGALVGLAIERSAELVVGVLGILKAGGAYVPLEIDLPRMRLDAMVRDSGVEFVVTRRRFLDRLTTTAVEAICLDDDVTFVEHDTTNPNVVMGTDDPAYVMFTSGSTGQPKGVAIRHTSIARLVFGNDYATFGPDRVFVQLAPASFDASTFEIWGALLHGARLIIAPAGPPDFRQLEGLLAHHAVTTLWLTASLFNQIIDDYPQSLTGVGELLVGGEALSVRHVRRAQQVLGARVQLINGYGPTEATTFATCYRIPPNLPPGLESIPIGRPIANTQVYVLDQHRQPVPIGVAGELYIGGAGVARDYLHRPALTAERFVPDPFSGQPGARLYRTGDHCRWRADGELEFLGRLDDQVKLRGFRIELGEIETALRQHPTVARCIVAVRDVGAGDRRLVAYVVAADRAGFLASELRDHLRSRLPDYMLPATFVALEQIPLTPSGKVDRDALPNPHGTSPDTVTDFVAPRNQVERTLAALWRELLACDRVGVHDDFFVMGGHSLLAVRLFTRIEQEFGCRLPLAVLFQKGTIAHLATLVKDEKRSEDIATVLPLQTSALGRPLFVLPTIGGELIFSPTLFEQLGRQFPIAGLQPSLVPRHLEQFRDFRATAAHFAAALRAYQPRGPYALVGYSYGGLMAFEVASILMEAGETIDLLGVIDTGPNRRGRTFGARDRWRRWVRVVLNVPSWFREDLSHFSARRLVGSAVRAVRGFYRTTMLGRRLELDDVFDVDRIPSQNQELMRTVFAAVCDYVPRRYQGTLTLFRATADPLLRGFEPDLGWGRFVDALELRYVKGNHETILHSHRVGELASQLSALLGRRVPDAVRPTESQERGERGQ